jgi:hypothetical protein
MGSPNGIEAKPSMLGKKLEGQRDCTESEIPPSFLELGRYFVTKSFGQLANPSFSCCATPDFNFSKGYHLFDTLLRGPSARRQGGRIAYAPWTGCAVGSQQRDTMLEKQVVNCHGLFLYRGPEPARVSAPAIPPTMWPGKRAGKYSRREGVKLWEASPRGPAHGTKYCYTG